MLYRGDNRIQTYSTKNHPCWVSAEVLASHKVIQKWYLAVSCIWRGGFAALGRPKTGDVRVPT